MQKIFGIIISIIAFSVVSNAQPLRGHPIAMMLETAEDQELAQNYLDAIDWYEQIYKENRDKDIAVRVANLQQKLRNYDRAENWYKRFLNKDEDNIFIDERFAYGNNFKAQGRFKEAAEQYQQYIDLGTDESKKEIARRELEGMKNAKNFDSNIETVIQFAGTDVNSAFTEYSPRVYNDGTLYFASIPAKKPIKTDGFNEDQYSRIFFSKRGEDGKLMEGEVLGDHVNRPGWHTGSPAFTRDGSTMYYTRAQLVGNELSESEIYFSKRQDEEWSPAIRTEGLSTDVIIKHPAVGELFGNDVLFFSSDMDGGYGGFDIYYATIKNDGQFAAPVNLGEKINTAQDDETPFYLNGQFYFSSNGRVGLGGLDIYKTEWDGTKWSEPINMGLGYNTTYDDFFLSFDNKGESGYLISNRTDESKKKMKSYTNCDDIYAFNIRQLVIDLLANVSSPQGPLNGATITVYDKSDASDPKTKTDDQGTTNEFQFLLDQDRTYEAVAIKEGFYPDTVSFNTAGILDDFTVKKSFTLEPKPVVPETETITMNQTIRLNSIYFDLDKWDILPAGEPDLRSIQDLMSKYPDMVIELGSHTDSQGISSYNQKLSQKRANSTKQWLVDRGVADERIKAVGYGESVILNQCKNGVRCTDDEHRFNRRSEFKIIAGPQTIEVTKEIISREKKN